MFGIVRQEPDIHSEDSVHVSAGIHTTLVHVLVILVTVVIVLEVPEAGQITFRFEAKQAF